MNRLSVFVSALLVASACAPHQRTNVNAFLDEHGRGVHLGDTFAEARGKDEALFYERESSTGYQDTSAQNLHGFDRMILSGPTPDQDSSFTDSERILGVELWSPKPEIAGLAQRRLEALLGGDGESGCIVDKSGVILSRVQYWPGADVSAVIEHVEHSHTPFVRFYFRTGRWDEREMLAASLVRCPSTGS